VRFASVACYGIHQVIVRSYAREGHEVACPRDLIFPPVNVTELRPHANVVPPTRRDDPGRGGGPVSTATRDSNVVVVGPFVQKDVRAVGIVVLKDVGAFGTVVQKDVGGFGTVEHKDVGSAGTVRKSLICPGWSIFPLSVVNHQSRHESKRCCAGCWG